LRILFDQGVPKPLQAYLSDHTIERAFLVVGVQTKMENCSSWPKRLDLSSCIDLPEQDSMQAHVQVNSAY